MAKLEKRNKAEATNPFHRIRSGASLRTHEDRRPLGLVIEALLLNWYLKYHFIRSKIINAAIMLISPDWYKLRRISHFPIQVCFLVWYMMFGISFYLKVPERWLGNVSQRYPAVQIQMTRRWHFDSESSILHTPGIVPQLLPPRRFHTRGVVPRHSEQPSPSGSSDNRIVLTTCAASGSNASEYSKNFLLF